MTWNMVVANPADESFTALLQVKTADVEQLRTILLTFNAPGAPTRDPNATSTTTSATTTGAPTTTASATSTTTTTG